MNEILSNIIVQRIACFFLAGLIGMLVHYTVKWCKGEITENLIGYLCISHARNTMGTITALIVAEATAMSTGMLDAATIQGVIGLGFLAGYSCDSAFNKSAQA